MLWRRDWKMFCFCISTVSVIQQQKKYIICSFIQGLIISRLKTVIIALAQLFTHLWLALIKKAYFSLLFIIWINKRKSVIRKIIHCIGDVCFFNFLYESNMHLLRNIFYCEENFSFRKIDWFHKRQNIYCKCVNIFLNKSGMYRIFIKCYIQKYDSLGKPFYYSWDIKF